MIYTISITGGRRITIPIEFRRRLSWDKSRKVLLKVEEGKIILTNLPNDKNLEKIK